MCGLADPPAYSLSILFDDSEYEDVEKEYDYERDAHRGLVAFVPAVHLRSALLDFFDREPNERLRFVRTLLRNLDAGALREEPGDGESVEAIAATEPRPSTTSMTIETCAGCGLDFEQRGDEQDSTCGYYRWHPGESKASYDPRACKGARSLTERTTACRDETEEYEVDWEDRMGIWWRWNGSKEASFENAPTGFRWKCCGRLGDAQACTPFRHIALPRGAPSCSPGSYDTAGEGGCEECNSRRDDWVIVSTAAQLQKDSRSD